MYPLLTIAHATLLLTSCLSLSPLTSVPKSSSLKPQQQKRGSISIALNSFTPSFEPEIERKRSPPVLEPYRPNPMVQLQTYPVASIPSRPKVVVFGATTSIGRQIVRTLMESKLDVDVVAFVSDYDAWLKLEEKEGEDAFVYADVIQRREMGASLTVLEGNLIDPQNVCGKQSDQNITEANLEISEYHSQQLYQAISGSTALISCLQPSRATNFYTDYLRVPFLRILNFNVSSWCSDVGHPYFVYLANKRILEEAELEQRRREAVIEFERERMKLEEQFDKYRSKEDEKYDSSIAIDLKRKRQRLGKPDIYSRSELFQDLVSRNDTIPLKSTLTDRIKFVRISDVNLGRSPWRLGNILTNVFGSTIMRYEDMGERLLKRSELVDTLVLRIGEIVREERNTNNTSLQLSTEGVVPNPSVVGIEDVSALASVASLTNFNVHDYWHSNSTKMNNYNSPILPSKHFTWAIRWAGQHLHPPQGLRPDGSSSAALCFVKAVQSEITRTRKKQVDAKGKLLVRLQKWVKAPWKIKPYAFTSIMTVYLTLATISWITLGETLLLVITKLKQMNTSQKIMTKLFS